jgi:hypothetical protein
MRRRRKGERSAQGGITLSVKDERERGVKRIEAGNEDNKGWPSQRNGIRTGKRGGAPDVNSSEWVLVTEHTERPR